MKPIPAEHFNFLLNGKTPIKKFSIELTNRCALACPNCSRTSLKRKGFIHDLSTVKQLDVAFIKRIFPEWLKDKNKNFMIDLTGNLGDAIYHPEFHEIISYLKSIDIKLQIITNGSHRNRAWWEKTASILGPDDLMVFSIDGLQDSNPIYRINSRWDDVMEAIKICVPHTNVQWKWIVFRHNEHQIEDAKALAKSLGVHTFLINKSGRFTKNDPMLPLGSEWVGQKNKNKTTVREFLKTRNKAKRFFMAPIIPALKIMEPSKTHDKNDLQVLARCQTGQDAFISCEGHFFPCCYTRDMTKRSWFLPRLEKIDLSQRTLQEVLLDPIWDELEKSWSKPKCAPEECLRSCGIAKEYQSTYQNNARSAEQEGIDNLTFDLNSLGPSDRP